MRGKEGERKRGGLEGQKEGVGGKKEKRIEGER